MKVDGNIQRGRAVENRFEVRIVQIDALAVPVDHRAKKSVLAHRSLKFFSRRLGRAHRQGGEAGQPIRIPADRRREFVIAFTGQAHRCRPVQLLHSGRRQRQHGQVDARVVHRGNAPVTEVGDWFDHVCAGF